MKLKLSSDLKTITAKILAITQEIHRIDEAIVKTKNAEPALQAELDNARKRLADAEVAVELDGATLDGKAVKAVREAQETIERAAGRLAGLESRRAEGVAQLNTLSETFFAARESFIVATRQAIETELLRPLVSQLRSTYSLMTIMDETLALPGNLEFTLRREAKLPGLLDGTVDLLHFEEQQGANWIAAHHNDPQAIELKQMLAEVVAATAALKAAA